MNIGIYDPYLDDLGGGEKYMMTIAQDLSVHHKVSVFWDNKEDFEGLHQRFNLKLDKVTLKKNIFSASTNLLERLMESSKYDAIIVLSDGSFPLVLSKKLFIHIQQPLPQVALASVMGKIKRTKINAIIYNSEYTKSYNQKLLSGITSKVLYPPVDLLPKDVKKENIILHVGRFRVTENSDFKKQDVMIAAFKDMVDKKKIKEWKFVLAVSVKEADEDKFALVQKSAKGYPISFLINKNNDELWDTYNKAKIYWHASGFGEDIEKHPEFAEHFGISTVEAMGAGAVPVVINSGGQKEIVTQNENGFLWETLDELARYTVKIAEDNRLREKMAQNSQLRSKDFNGEKFKQTLLSIIEG